MSGLPHLSPIWLRPAALCAVGLAHVAVLVALPGVSPSQGAAEQIIELAIVTPGEESAQPDIASIVDPPAESPPVAKSSPVAELPQTVPESSPEPIFERPSPPEIPLPEVAPERMPEPPVPIVAAPSETEKPAIENRDAIAVQAPSPPPERAAPVPAPKPPPVATLRTKQESAAVRPARPERAPPSAAPLLRQPATGGVTNAPANAGYSARVRGILQARANALAIEDADGSVGITFVIASNGRLASHSISRPSGNFQIDRAIRSMLASISFPPPPGGQYSGSVTVRVR